MKIPNHVFTFPKTLPNDLEGFAFFYPAKFPGIVAYYENIAKEVTADPEAFRIYGHWAHDELFAGFHKIKKDFDAGDQDDMAFLVDIDQRLNKLTCYRFWVVNYLFPDGPVHDFFVDMVRKYARILADTGDTLEAFETKALQIERDMLQSDYADLYLRQALSGVRVAHHLEQNPKTSLLLREAENIINAGREKMGRRSARSVGQGFGSC